MRVIPTKFAEIAKVIAVSVRGNNPPELCLLICFKWSGDGTQPRGWCSTLQIGRLTLGPLALTSFLAPSMGFACMGTGFIRPHAHRLPTGHFFVGG